MSAPASRPEGPPLCPSAQPRADGAFAFGVVGGTPERQKVGYLEARVPVSDELLAMAGPVDPVRVFRFAAPCAGSGCQHFDGSDCRLATKLVQLTPMASKTLPACTVRPDCRWWRQEGKAACMRCSEILTRSYTATEEQRMAGNPAV